MNTFEIILIVGLVLGVIGSNFALIRYANKFKVPPSVKQHFVQEQEQEQEQQEKEQAAQKTETAKSTPEQTGQSTDKNDSA